MIQLFVGEISTIKPIIIKSFEQRDVIALSQALHRIRGAIAYLILPELGKALEVFQKSVYDAWDDENILQKNYDAAMRAMDNFLKASAN